MKKEEKETLLIKPFEGCDLQVKVDLKKNKKRNRIKPFPHNMQLDNMHLLQQENYHRFNGEAAIYLEKVKYIRFDHELYDIPFYNMGKKLKFIGYRIMLCNPHFTQEQLIDCLYHIFVEFCQIPQNKNNIERVKKLGNYKSLTVGNIKFTEENRRRIEIGAEEIMQTPFQGWIGKQAKVIYNPDYDLTNQEKKELANELLGSRKSRNTLEKIYSTLANWDSKEKPTQKNIARELDISLRTIKRYWKPAKEKLELTTI
ncbi:hypothetical protein V6B16_01245 [Salinimicrobium catena]|uniref:hypothetical protein n=1 Tax=Salinimicrobium catena TaxID=390640 RepID=UPI002FE4F03A